MAAPMQTALILDKGFFSEIPISMLDAPSLSKGPFSLLLDVILIP